MFRDPASILMSIPGLLLAITFHELAHGYAADALGDPTPRASGRLSLNPIAHLDPIGTLMLIVFRFGWAKPVPVNPMYFRDREKGMLLTGLAGPAANIALAVVSMYFLMQFRVIQATVYGTMLVWAFRYNIWLAVFNMIPIPPLDGSHVVRALIPYNSPLRRTISVLDQYGWMILFILLMTGILASILFPVSTFIQNTIIALLRPIIF